MKTIFGIVLSLVAGSFANGAAPEQSKAAYPHLVAVEDFKLADLCGAPPALELGGWTSAAYYSNNIPLSFADDDMGSFDDLPDRVNLNQQWLYLGKQVDGSNGIDFGGRIDLVYGTDAQKSQSYGNPRALTRGLGTFDASLDHGVYGWAIPQLYGEIAIQDLSVQVGHFYATGGYEKTQAKSNFFHSHSLTFFDSEPFTHTGVLGEYKGIEGITLLSGWAAGWDSGFDSVNSGSIFLGGFEIEGDYATLGYHTTCGNFGWKDGGGDDSYSHSIVLETRLTDKLDYIAQSDLLETDSTTISRIDTVGLTQYLIYKWTDAVHLGGRVEWWKSDGDSYYEATSGVNLFLLKNLVLRPELRQDWIPALDFKQTTFAVDMVFDY